MSTFTGKYIGGIIIEDKTDVEKLRKLSMCEALTDEELEAYIGKGVAFDINYLEMFWISKDRREILDSGLQLVIMKNPDYKE